MNKWVKRLAIFLVLAACAIGISAKYLLTKEVLVEEIEKSINSRVQIGSFDVSLFSVPAKVTLRDVVLAERDNNVLRKVPYAQRGPIGQAALECKEVSFELTLWQLFSKKIYVNAFELDGLHARVTLYEDGTNSLDALFAEPAEKEKKEKKPKSFNAREKEEFVTQLDSVSISNVSFDLLIEKTGLLLAGSECAVEVQDIQVNPNALEMVNEASVKLHSKVEVFDTVERGVKFGEIGLEGVADAKLFDPETGDIDPDVVLDLNISESSYISTEVPYVQKVWDAGKKLEKYGVNLGSLPKQATFGRSRKIAGTYKRGRVDVQQDVSLVIHDWEVAINEKSWLDSGSENHAFFVDISASKKSSNSVLGHFEDLLKKAPREIRGSFEKTLNEEWLVDGKLTLKLSTKGKLSRPKVKVLTQLPDIEELIKEYAKKSALDFMLKKLGN